MAVARGSHGEVTDLSVNSLDCLAPGDESVLIHTFGSSDKIQTIEYYFYYDDDPYYASAVQEISTKYTETDGKVEVTLTNNGTHDISYPYAYILFFDENDQLLDYEWNSFYNNDGKLLHGESVSQTVYYYGDGEYDHIGIYVIASYSKN